MRRIPVCLALLLLTACVKPVTWVGVSALPVALPGHFSVRGDAVWNRLDGGDPDTYDAWWTANGSSLDLLRFHTGIASGQPLIRSKAKTTKATAVFQASMQPEEIVELYEAYLTSGGSTFKRDKLAPAPFAGGNGFRFEYTLIRKADDVTLKGMGYGVVRKDTLYLMTFQAPRIHYYAALLPKVEEMAKTAQITD